VVAEMTPVPKRVPKWLSIMTKAPPNLSGLGAFVVVAGTGFEPATSGL
jgi:hypothetical protein